MQVVLPSHRDIPSTLKGCYAALDEFLLEHEADLRESIKNAGNGDLLRLRFDLDDDRFEELWSGIVEEGLDPVRADLGMLHSGLGRWIRSNWIYPSLRGIPSFISLRFYLAGVMHFDDMSSEIITGYYRYLNDLPYRIPIQFGAIIACLVIGALILVPSVMFLVKDQKIRDFLRQNRICILTVSSLAELMDNGTVKKAVRVTRTITSAFFPIIFLVAIGPIIYGLGTEIPLNYYQENRYALVSIYVLSGLIFAFNSVCNKSFYKHRSVLKAHIFAAVSVILFFIRWFTVNDQYTLAEHSWLLLYVPTGVVSLTLGYTLYSAIKAAILYVKT